MPNNEQEPNNPPPWMTFAAAAIGAAAGAAVTIAVLDNGSGENQTGQLMPPAVEAVIDTSRTG